MCEQCTFDGSVLVRAELTVAIQWFVIDFEQRFSELFIQLNKDHFMKQLDLKNQNGVNKQNNNPKAVVMFGNGDEEFSDDLK